VSAGFVTLGDHDVDAVLDMALRVFGAACKRGHRNARLVGLVDDVLRRRAEGVGDQLDRMLECHLDVRASHRMQPAEHAFVALLIVGQRRNTKVGKGFGDKVAMALRDQLVDVDGRALGGHLGRHDDVDAVRHAVGILVHPAQDVLQVVCVVEPHAAEHAEAARLADRSGNLLRRREDEDRIVDAEAVAQLGAHQDGVPTWLACTSSAGRSSVWSLAQR
jgi:hypothetical protein